MVRFGQKLKVKPWEIRFWPKIQRQDNGCWTWQGFRNQGGYGRFHVCSQDRMAHRYMWEWVFGPIESGLCICHRCDNPPCVNPFHLFKGTRRDNNYDAIKKGRLCLMKDGNPKLDKPQILEIVRLHDLGIPRRIIAEKFKVHYSYPWLLANGFAQTLITGRTRVKQTGP